MTLNTGLVRGGVNEGLARGGAAVTDGSARGIEHSNTIYPLAIVAVKSCK